MKEKKEKVFKGMTAPVDVHLDIPDEEIWTYKIDGLAEPHINKPLTNFTAKKIVFTVLLVIAVFISMYFSVRVVSRVPFEYNAVGDGTYEFTKFNNTGYIGHLDIDYAIEIVYDEENADPATNFTLQKDESKPISTIPQFCFNCDEKVETIYIGKSVKEIDGKAFFTCKTLKNFIVDEENEYYCDIDGVLYNKNGSILLQYPASKADLHFVLPESVSVTDIDGRTHTVSFEENVTDGSSGSSIFEKYSNAVTVSKMSPHLRTVEVVERTGKLFCNDEEVI